MAEEHLTNDQKIELLKLAQNAATCKGKTLVESYKEMLVLVRGEEKV